MLSIQNLTFEYSSNKEARSNVFKMNFHLDIFQGEILSIIGPSGSGKSTLLNLIAGFNTPTSGKILLNDTDISKQSIPDRSVTTVFQDHNLFPHLDVFTNVAIGLKPSLKLSSTEKDKVEDALRSVGLSDYMRRKPAQLSGGQRQRVALSRALVRNHQVLLLDEPLAALGPAMREEIIDLLKDIILKKNIVALLVSHQPTDALRASKRTAFINDGKVLDIADTDILLKHSEYSEIRNYLGLL